MTAAPTHWILTLVCEDRPGIVHAISGAIVAAGGNITESQQFSSDDTGRFFMRLQVESAASRDAFESALAPVTVEELRADVHAAIALAVERAARSVARHTARARMARDGFGLGKAS